MSNGWYLWSHCGHQFAKSNCFLSTKECRRSEYCTQCFWDRNSSAGCHGDLKMPASVRWCFRNMFMFYIPVWDDDPGSTNLILRLITIIILYIIIYNIYILYIYYIYSTYCHIFTCIIFPW